MIGKLKALGLAVLPVVALAAGAPGAQAINFEASSYPATVTGSNTKGSETLTTEAGAVQCSSHFEGTLSAASSTLTITPKYSECTAFGFLSATVTTEGCTYVFHATEEVSAGVFNSHADVSCPEGKSIKIAAATCKAEVKAQTGLTTVKSTNSGSSVTVQPNVTGIAMTVTQDGFGCPFAGTGAKTASYHGDVLISRVGGGSVGVGGGATSTTLSTSLVGEGKEGEAITVNEGAKVKDTATLSGTNASKATGTVIYKVYADSSCKELVTTAGEVTVTAGSVPASSEKELTAGALYYWQAEYGGDSLHQASISVCSKEVATVKAAVTLSTTLVGSGTETDEAVEGKEITVAADATVADTATLSGTNASKATGTVIYKVYADKECKELIDETGGVSVEAGKAPASEQLELEEGTYHWRAFYGGDSLHQSGSSPCDEVVTVLATTTLATWLSGEGEEGEMIEVSEEAAVTDSATISGANAAEATGTVEYFVYADADCEELVAEAGEVEVEGAEVPPSEAVEPGEPGTYYWQAEYSGDGANHSSTSLCGSEVVIATPLVTTTLSGGEMTDQEIEVVEGTPITDQATLHGKNAAEATGTVGYFVYADDKCEELVTEAGEVEVKAGEVPPSEAVELEEPGTYYWQAEYSGDEKNPPGASLCSIEVSVVVTSTSLSTILSGGEEEGEEIEVEEGTPVSDQALLSGANAASAEGFVDYTVYSDSECTEVAELAGEATVNEGSVGSSDEVTLPAGTYYWQAEYSGDDVNKASKSPCGAEVLTVTTPITMTLSGESLTGDEIQVDDEAAVTGGATLHGENASEATGTVEYFVYADDDCEELVAEAGEVEVEGAEAPPSEEVELEETGVYYWQAHYSGDEKNPEATSVCEATQEIVWDNKTWKYAALGDSFSSGEGVWNTGGIFYWPTHTHAGPNWCHRSPEGWPALIAERAFGKAHVEGPAVFKYPADRFIFRACSGAETINIWRAGPVAAADVGGQYDEYILNGNWARPTPAQVRFMYTPAGGPNNDIAIVSMTITGNDSGFAQIAADCIQWPWEVFYSPVGCQLTIANEEKEGFKRIEERLPIVLQKVAATAPRAKIRLFLYPRVINFFAPVLRVGPLGGARINNRIRGLNGVTAAWSLVNFTERLNEKIINVANGAGVGARLDVNWAMMDALAGHRIGDAFPWVNRIAVPRPFTESFHPNQCGHRAMAEAALPWVAQGAAPIGLCFP